MENSPKSDPAPKQFAGLVHDNEND